MSLESFWKRKSQKSSTSSSPNSRDPPIEVEEQVESPNTNAIPTDASIPTHENMTQSVPNTSVETDDTRIYDVDLLPHDPEKRIPIMQYPPNDRDAVRRGYITMKRCEPRTHDFPQRQIGGDIFGEIGEIYMVLKGHDLGDEVKEYPIQMIPVDGQSVGSNVDCGVCSVYTIVLHFVADLLKVLF